MEQAGVFEQTDCVRFLILTQYFPPEIGAPQIRLAALQRILRKSGHQVEVVTALPHHLVGKIYPEYRRRFYLKETYEGTTVHRAWVYAASGTGVARLANYLSFSLTCIIGLLFAERPDYIFVESPPLFLGVPGAFYSALRRVPMIFNVADLWPDSVRELGVIKPGFLLRFAELLEHWIYGRARFVNAITRGIAHTLIASKRVPPTKVLLFPNGVDRALFSPRFPDAKLAERLNLTNSKVFIYAGTHGVAQGLQSLLEAAKLLEGTPARFLFIGDGPVKSALMANAARCDLNNVTFVPMQRVEEMPRYFSLATASIVPLVKGDLFKSAQPSKILASVACGVPVIFCGEGDAADLIRSKNAGLVVPPEDGPALAAAAKLLISTPQLRDDLAQNAAALAEEFDWDRVVRTWLAGLSGSSPRDQR